MQFYKVLEGRAKENNKIKIVDVGRNEKEIEIKEMKTLHSVMEVLKEKYPGLTHNRVPVCNSAAPLEADFDTICNCLLETNVNCPIIVNCQVHCQSKQLVSDLIARIILGWFKSFYNWMCLCMSF